MLVLGLSLEYKILVVTTHTHTHISDTQTSTVNEKFKEGNVNVGSRDRERLSRRNKKRELKASYKGEARIMYGSYMRCVVEEPPSNQNQCAKTHTHKYNSRAITGEREKKKSRKEINRLNIFSPLSLNVLFQYLFFAHNYYIHHLLLIFFSRSLQL